MRVKQAESDLFDEYYLALAWSPSTNRLSKELDKIDELLDEIPQLLDRVQADLNAHLKTASPSSPGRRAVVTAEQALRSAILKQLAGVRLSRPTPTLFAGAKAIARRSLDTRSIWVQAARGWCCATKFFRAIRETTKSWVERWTITLHCLARRRES